MTTSRPRARSAAAKEAQTRRTMRAVAVVGTVPVIGVAGYASYYHITDLAVRYGQSQSISHLMPVAIDGLMVVAAVAVIAHRRDLLPKLAFLLGALFTLGANLMSVHQTEPGAYVVAGMPAVTLLVSAELLLRLCLPTQNRPKQRSRNVKQKSPDKAVSGTRLLAVGSKS